MKIANDNIIIITLILSSLHLLYTSQHVAIAYQQVLPKSFSLIHKHYNSIRISQSLSSPSSSLLSSTNNNENIPISTTTSEKSIPKCYYQCGGSGSGGDNKRWKQRIRLEELKVGQMIIGERIGKADLLNGKTGPKIFFECGIGRIDHKNKWQMVSGMYRVAKNYAKPKVVKKKIQRLSNQQIELYVYKIRLDEGRLEVCTSLEEFENEMKKKKERDEVAPMVSVSSLKVGQEVIGQVKDVRAYGVMVDVGANRHGLLHIQTVADLYRRYIHKEEGLIEAGLERGAKVKLVVSSIERKRLFLDFTPETKQLILEQIEAEAEEDDEEENDYDNDQNVDPSVDEAAAWAAYNNDDVGDSDQNNDASVDEAAAWAAYYQDDEEEDEDDYDEDKEIEDALGLGFY